MLTVKDNTYQRENLIGDRIYWLGYLNVQLDGSGFNPQCPQSTGRGPCTRGLNDMFRVKYFGDKRLQHEL